MGWLRRVALPPSGLESPAGVVADGMATGTVLRLCGLAGGPVVCGVAVLSLLFIAVAARVLRMGPLPPPFVWLRLLYGVRTAPGW